MIALFVAGGLAFGVVLSLPRMLLGPTLYDRALAAAWLCVQAVLIAAAVAVVSRNAAMIDVCFGLLAAMTALSAAMLKFFRARTLQPPLSGGGGAN